MLPYLQKNTSRMEGVLLHGDVPMWEVFRPLYLLSSPSPTPSGRYLFLWIGSLESNFHIEYGPLWEKYVPVEYLILYINVFF